MRRLTFLILIAAALYSGYWFVGVRAVEKAADFAIENARDDGFTINYADLQTRGFPSRFDTTVDQLELTSPDGTVRWEAPFFQIFALSYQPNRVIAAFADTQTLRIGGQQLDISTDGLRSSAGVRANSDLSFDTFTAEVGTATVLSDFGWSTGVDRGLVALRAVPDAAQVYDAYADVSGIVLPANILGLIDPSDALSGQIDRIVLDAVVTVDQVLDRHVFDAGTPPQVERVAVNSFDLTWGQMTLSAEGAVDVDARGVLQGQLTFTTPQWRDLIDMLVAAGVVESGVARTAVTVAQTMAGQDGVLELPILFKNGLMSLGPLPLGAAPQLR